MSALVPHLPKADSLLAARSRQKLSGKGAPMAVVPPFGVGSQQRTLLWQAARADVDGERTFEAA